MKKPSIAGIVMAAFLAPQAFAQANQFQGFSLGLNANSADTTSEIVTSGVPNKGSDLDTNVALQLQYNMAVGNAVVLGLGATAGLGDLNAGKHTGLQAKLKDSYSLYFAPGYAINNNWEVYGKLAYVQARLQNAANSTISFDNGYAYGVGVQTFFGKYWYGQAEYLVNQFSDMSPSATETDKLNTNVFSLGVGYKF